MKRSRRFRARVAKAAPPEAAPLELSVKLLAKGDLRRDVEAMSPEKLQAAVAEAFVAAVAKISAEDPPPAAPPEPTKTRVFRRAILSKAKGAEEERYVLGVAMEPDEVDTQGDTENAEEIRKAAFRFMEDYRSGGDTGHLGLMHKEIVDHKLAVLESYLQKSDEDIEGEHVKAGSWLVAMRIIDDELWKSVKAGDYNGLSIGGTAVKEPVA